MNPFVSAWFAGGRPRPVSASCAAALFAFLLSTSLEAQLISPGPLTEAHANLEGIRNCTTCHELGTRGASEERCLSCHEPLAVRISEDRGLHAQAEGSCAACHKEHSGRGVDIVRFDTLGFEHERQTGFALMGAHGEAGCRNCHEPQRITAPDVRIFKREGGALGHTWLGVATECLSCHRSEDPHEGQFARAACSDCHNQGAWDPADGFDHDAARYPLTGAHRSVACADCHSSAGADPASLRYRPLEFAQCGSCHTDPHRSVMGARCSECHSTSDWGRLKTNDFEDGFDHASTGYALTGAHSPLACAHCHDTEGAQTETINLAYRPETLRRTYPRPIVDTCLSCHLDYHEEVFAESEGGALCSNCHGEDTWLPSSYDLFRHNADTDFELAGAHLAVPCATCHLPAGEEVWRLEFVDLTCLGCHSEDDPHAEQFNEAACTDCHGIETFEIGAFDHEQTSYSLSGAHVDIACEGCHLTESDGQGRTFIRYRPLESTCEACHGGQR